LFLVNWRDFETFFAISNSFKWITTTMDLSLIAIDQ
jgi:hypothetical protein